MKIFIPNLLQNYGQLVKNRFLKPKGAELTEATDSVTTSIVRKDEISQQTPES